MSSKGGIPDQVLIIHNRHGKLGEWVHRSEALLDANGKPLWFEHPNLGAKADIVALLLTDKSDIGSFNNDIGVPLTILDAAVGDDYLIVEIGTNSPGEIEAMAAIARPDLAVITKVGRAHLEGFGSVEAVAAEKASLLGHLCPGRPAIVNADCRPLRPHLRIPGAVVLCGEAEDADLRLTGRDGAAGWFEVNGRDRFHLGLPGRHNAVNALCAVAVARRLGVPDSMIDAALGACEPVDMRMSRREIGAITVYNDAYNANPDSMIASLEAFGEQTAGVSRRVVVLGDMNELGAAAPELHREVGRSLLEMTRTTPVDHLVLVGELAAFIADPLEASWPPDHLTRLPELTATNAPDIARLLHPGDAVLLKASRTVALEQLITAIHDPIAP